MRIATANIMGLPKMPRAEVEADLRLVTAHADIVGWQEIHHDYYVDAVAALPGWSTDGLEEPGGAPISWRSAGWRLVASGSELLHPGTSGVCMERRILWVVLERRSRLPWRRRRITVTNRHYVSKAWHRLEEPDDDLRRRMWLDGNQTDRDLCTALLARYPHPMAGTGDYNRHAVPVMGRTLAGRPVGYGIGQGIDYVWFVPGRDRVWRLGMRRTLPLNSDHPGRIATATLHPRK